MANDEVRPALTAEEWADIASDPEWWEERAVEAGLDMGGWLHSDVTADRRHAGAAIALYGQPFGFTQEEVIFLRAIEVIQFKTLDVPYRVADYGGPYLQSIAAKIAALLPPEPV